MRKECLTVRHYCFYDNVTAILFWRVQITKQVFIHKLGEFCCRQILSLLHKAELKKTYKPRHKEVIRLGVSCGIEHQSFVCHLIELALQSFSFPPGRTDKFFQRRLSKGKTGCNIRFFLRKENGENLPEFFVVGKTGRLSVQPVNKRHDTALFIKMMAHGPFLLYLLARGTMIFQRKPPAGSRAGCVIDHFNLFEQANLFERGPDQLRLSK